MPAGIPPAAWAAADAVAKEASGPFTELFPGENIRHHFVGQDQERGVYAKELRVPAGMWLISHSHSYDHLSILANGIARLTVDGKEQTLTGPCAVTIAAGKAHTLTAITDVTWYCIHPTNETDATKVDEAILSG